MFLSLLPFSPSFSVFSSFFCIPECRTKLRAPEKAVEAVVTALLTSAQRTTAAVALLSGSAPPPEDDEDDAA